MYLLLNNSKFLYQIVESLLFCLIYNNIECKLVSKIDLTNDNDIYIIYNINIINDLPQKYIVYNFEQLNTARKWSKAFFTKLKNALLVFDYSKININILKNNNIDANFIPFGWTPIIEPEYNISENNKTIDLIFLGSLNSRRSEITNKIDVIINDKCFYNEYEDLTKIAKFSLNIHYYDGGTILELTRIIPLICRGVIVISERSSDKFYDYIFDDICIFVDNFKNINEIIKSYNFSKCIENKNKLIKKLNYVKIISENINLFKLYK